MKKEPDKIEIGKVEIKIGEKTIGLKPEQVRELSKVLRDLLGEDKEPEVRHHWHTNTISSPPIYIYPNSWPWYSTPMWGGTIICGNQGSAISGSALTTSSLQNSASNTCTLTLQNS